MVAAYGGTWETAMDQAVVKPFEAQYNVKVVVTLPGNSAAMLAQLRAEKGNPTIDVALLGGGLETVAANEGLFEPLDFSKIPNYQNVYDLAKSPVEGYGPSVAFSGVKLAYNTDEVSPAPTSWDVLWDPKYSGHVGMYNADNNGGLMLLYLESQLNGGSIDNMAPGFQKMASLNDNNAIFTSSSADMQDMFAQGTLWAGIIFDGRGAALIKDGLPIKMVCPDEGCFVTGTYANVVAGSQNKDLGEAFINQYLSPDSQKAFADLAGYGPVNKTVQLSGQTADLVIYGQDQVKKLISLPWDQINAHRDAWVEQWNKQVLSK